MAVAEHILQLVMNDWDEKLHPDKIKRVRMSGTKRALYDARGAGEVAEFHFDFCFPGEE